MEFWERPIKVLNRIDEISTSCNKISQECRSVGRRSCGEGRFISSFIHSFIYSNCFMSITGFSKCILIKICIVYTAWKASVFKVILVRIFFCIFLHLDWIQRDTQMRENVGKMRTRITPNTDTFYTVLHFTKRKSQDKKSINICINILDSL